MIEFMLPYIIDPDDYRAVLKALDRKGESFSNTEIDSLVKIYKQNSIDVDDDTLVRALIVMDLDIPDASRIFTTTDAAAFDAIVDIMQSDDASAQKYINLALESNEDSLIKVALARTILDELLKQGVTENNRSDVSKLSEYLLSHQNEDLTQCSRLILEVIKKCKEKT